MAKIEISKFHIPTILVNPSTFDAIPVTKKVTCKLQIVS